MRLDLAEIARVAGMNYDYDIDLPWPRYEDIKGKGNITGRLHFANTGSTVVALGSVDGIAVVECGRCVNSAELPLHAQIEERFAVENLGLHTLILVSEGGEEGEDPLCE